VGDLGVHGLNPCNSLYLESWELLRDFGICSLPVRERLAPSHRDIDLLNDYERNYVMIIKDRYLFKNTLG
jgi:hypothetical protein